MRMAVLDTVAPEEGEDMEVLDNAARRAGRHSRRLHRRCQIQHLKLNPMKA